jgi:hypothetical protein
MKEYPIDGKVYFCSEISVDFLMNLRNSARVCNLCMDYDKDVYLENDHAVIGVDENKEFIYGNQRVDGKSILASLAIAMEGDTLKIITECCDDHSKDLVSKIKKVLESEDKHDPHYDETEGAK